MHASTPPGPFNQAAVFRWGLAVAAAAMLPLLWSVLCTAASATVPWNAARLAPAFALAEGLPIYALRDSGLHLGWFYGPGFPLWNLPATLASSPTAALFIAGFWQFLTLLGPLGLVLAAGRVARGWQVPAAALFGGCLLLGNMVTNYGLYFIHVDALCLAAGLGSCLAAHRAVGAGQVRWLALSAVLLAVAVWTKQVAVLLAPAILLWLIREGHAAAARRWALWTVLALGLSSIAVFAWFGAEEILFNLWYVHSRNPWRGGAGLLGTELLRLAASAWVWLPAIALAVGLNLRRPAEAAPVDPLVRLLTWAAVWQLPAGLLALLKAGGGLNSLHSLHYALVILLLRLFAGFARPLPAGSRAFRLCAAAWLLAVALPLGQAAVFSANPGSSWRVPHSHDRLAALARENPGRYYFPWNPLVTLMVERRIQPLDDALYCLWLARLEPPVGKVRAAVPASPIILYEEPAQSRFALRYFPTAKSTAP